MGQKDIQFYVEFVNLDGKITRVGYILAPTKAQAKKIILRKFLSSLKIKEAGKN